jgi:hypothetical protein
MPSNQSISVAFKIYKSPAADADGVTYLADVLLAILDGPLAGLVFSGIEIKTHAERGLQVVLPPTVECFGIETDAGRRVEDQILTAFAASCLSVIEGPKAPDFDQYPEPNSKYSN